MSKTNRNKTNRLAKNIQNSFQRCKRNGNVWWEDKQIITEFLDMMKSLNDDYNQLMDSLKKIIQNNSTTIAEKLGMQVGSITSFSPLLAYALFSSESIKKRADGTEQIYHTLTASIELQNQIFNLLEGVEKVRDTFLTLTGGLPENIQNIKYDLFFEGKQMVGAEKGTRELINIQGTLEQFREAGLVKLLSNGDIALKMTQKTAYQLLEQTTGNGLVATKMQNAGGEVLTNTALNQLIHGYAASTGQTINEQGYNMGWAAQWYRGIQSMSNPNKTYKLIFDQMSMATGGDEGFMQQKYIKAGSSKISITSLNNTLVSSQTFLRGFIPKLSKEVPEFANQYNQYLQEYTIYGMTASSGNLAALTQEIITPLVQQLINFG